MYFPLICHTQCRSHYDLLINKIHFYSLYKVDIVNVIKVVSPFTGPDHPGGQSPLSPDAEAHTPTATEPHPRHLGEGSSCHGKPPPEGQRGQGYQGITAFITRSHYIEEL